MKVLRSEGRDQSLSNNMLPPWEVSPSFVFWDASHTCERIACGFTVLVRDGDECKISRNKSHKFRAGMPSDMTSDSVELRETAVCFLHIPQIGTRVRLPKMRKFLLILI